MAKSKDADPVEYYKGVVRKLKSELRHLKKELSRFHKREHFLEDEVVEEPEEVYEDKPRCPKCSSRIYISNLGNRRIESCIDCSYRKTFKV